MTIKKDILRKIREHCVDCMGGYMSEVENCPSKARIPEDDGSYPGCALWDFRMGSDPFPNPTLSAAVKKNKPWLKKNEPLEVA